MKKKKIIVSVGVTIVIAAIGISVVVKSLAKESDVPTGIVTETITLEKQDLEKMISVTGTIASSNLKVISSEVTDTKILDLNVAVGDSVKKGDVIARLDSSNIEIKLKASQTALEVVQEKSQIEINSVKRNMDYVQITRDTELERSNKAVADAYIEYADAVAKKDISYQEYQNAIKKRKEKETVFSGAKSSAENIVKETETRRKALESAQNTYDIASEEYENATKESVSANDTAQTATIAALKKKKDDALVALNATKSSYNSTGAITTSVESDKSTKEAELSQAKTEESTKEAEYKTAVANVDASVKVYDKEVQSLKDTTRSTEKAVADQKDSLLSAQINSKNSSNSQEEIDVKKYKEQIEECVIVAPMDGIITSVALQKGDIYKSGEIVTIQNTNEFMVSAAVDQYDISDISTSMNAIIKTETTGDTEMKGIVTFVSPVPKSSASTNTGSTTTTTNSSDYEIKVAIQNSSERLRIGMTAKTSIILKALKDVFVVPYYCIQEDVDGSFYITISEDGTTETGMVEKNIVVQKALETDYYVAIEASNLVEGMNILVPALTENDSQVQ